MWNFAPGLSQFYTDNGNTGGIPVIYIHGFPFDHSVWDDQVKLTPPRFRAISYDVRGHGQSHSDGGYFNIEFFTDDLFSLIDKLGLERPVLCGLSMGGYIALRALERKPDGFRAMILCDTRSEADTNIAKINRARAIQTVLEKGVGKYAEDSLQSLFWPENIRMQHPAVHQVRNIIEKTPAKTIYGTLMAMAARTDTTEFLNRIQIPVLIMAGEHDSLTPPIVAESLHENISGSELKIIKDAGHLSNLENPEEFNIALLEFLEKVR